METGAIVGSIDVAQVTLYVFWVFFALLIWHIRMEDRREGYPLENDLTGDYQKDSWLWLPSPKTFTLSHGRGTVEVPNERRDTREIAAARREKFPGAPLSPTGNPLKDGVGPASWAERDDSPDITFDGENRIVPMRIADGFDVAEGDPDPRGMSVIGLDKEVAGTIRDLWVDRSEQLIRYLEVDTGGGTVLVPINFAKFETIRGGVTAVHVRALTAAQIAEAPGAGAESVTRLQEDKILGYFGGGKLYALAHRAEPWL